MDAHGLAAEAHPNYEEALLVLEGRMELEVVQDHIELGPGDLYIIPRGASHRVLRSRGVLLLIDS